jgi:aryl-alcohol dehydrogenase-like predicted oxidoreductase
LQVAIAWLLADPLIVSPVIGANTVEQLKDALGSVEIHLTPAEKIALDRASAWKEEEE